MASAPCRTAGGILLAISTTDDPPADSVWSRRTRARELGRSRTRYFIRALELTLDTENRWSARFAGELQAARSDDDGRRALAGLRVVLAAGRRRTAHPELCNISCTPTRVPFLWPETPPTASRCGCTVGQVRLCCNSFCPRSWMALLGSKSRRSGSGCSIASGCCSANCRGRRGNSVANAIGSNLDTRGTRFLNHARRLLDPMLSLFWGLSTEFGRPPQPCVAVGVHTRTVHGFVRRHGLERFTLPNSQTPTNARRTRR